MDPFIKQMLKIALPIFAVVGVISGAIYFLTTGSISVITADEGADITITQANNLNPDEPITGRKQISKRVGVGEYSVRIETANSAMERVVKTDPFKPVKVEFDTKQQVYAAEFVASIPARSILAEPNALLFVNNQYDVLQRLRLDATTPDLAIPDLGSIFNTQWVNATTGLIMGDNPNTQTREIYIYRNGSLNRLGLPASINRSLVSSASLSANGRLAFAVGKEVYTYDTLTNSGLNKIYTAGNSDPYLALSDRHLLVGSSVEGTHDESGETATLEGDTNGEKPTIESVIIDLSNGTTLKEDGDTIEAHWSPDGSQLLHTSSKVIRITDAQFKPIQTLPKDVQNPVWQNDDTLIYSRGDTLWRYTASTKTSVKLAVAPLGSAIASIASTGPAAVMFSTNSPDDDSAIYRLNLSRSTTSAQVQNAQLILPLNEPTYSVELFNLSRPTLLIKTDPASPPASRNAAVLEARAALAARGVNPDAFTIQGGDLNTED